jgi:soluble lytic murein transglycosylase-like protein
MSRALSRSRTACLGLLAGAAVAVALLAGAPAAQADFYYCTAGGKTWVTNSPGKHCRLAMKTAAPGRPSEPGAAGSSRRPDPDVRPRAPRSASPVNLPEERLWRLVLEAADRYHLPPAFVLAVIKVESGFNPRAVSRVGARGLMQLMPGTAQSLGVDDSFDPRQNVMGGCKYLRMLANRFDGDMARTLAGYHAGGGAVAKKEGVPYAATEQYVRWVLDRYYQYKVLLGSAAM